MHETTTSETLIDVESAAAATIAEAAITDPRVDREGRACRVALEIAPLLASLTLDEQGRPSFAGEPVAPVDPGAFGEPAAADDRAAALQQLTFAIYARFHCNDPSDASQRSASTTSAAQWAQRTHAYQAANIGRDRWDPGWVVEGVEPDGSVRVAKGDRRRRELPGRFASQDPTRPWLNPGDTVSVASPASSTTVQPGFFFLLGQRPGSADDEHRIARVYWNLEADGAQPWIAATSGALQRAGLPFRAKVLLDPGAFNRCDSAVLYLARRHFEACLPLVREIATEVGEWLGERTPPFTLRLAPGVAVAEDPGESFGINRARLIAQGLLTAHSAGESIDPIQAVVESFTNAGLDPQRPYLNPGNLDRYQRHANPDL